MSRSYRSSKGPGHEYWGRRSNGPFKWTQFPGRFSKKVVHGQERRQGKKQILQTVE